MDVNVTIFPELLSERNDTNATKSLKSLVPTESTIQFTLGVVGNFSAMFVLLKHAKEHKWKTFYRLVAALVLTDLFGILTTSPVVFALYENKFRWPNLWLCDYMSFMMIFASMATMFIVAAMSLDRFIAVYCPFFYGKMMKKRRIHVMTAGMWIAAGMIAILPVLGFGHNVKHWPYSWCFFDYFGRHVSDVLYSIFYATIGLIVIVMTTTFNGLVIVRLARGQYTVIRRGSMKGNRQNNRRNEIFIMVFLIAILLTFAICWTPIMIRIYINTSGRHQHDFRADILALRFASWNQILDPWIYILLRKDMLVRFLRLIGRKDAESSSSKPHDSTSESCTYDKNKMVDFQDSPTLARENIKTRTPLNNSTDSNQHLLLKHL
ncbi:hypothetical protein FSP39_006502 [Pinctada imbricata]|uniref:Thromboxane A2 receptor n=1 Tax=Pinctada imbricata TaxID=66713 RepID=A0AA89BST9_PINIB|nr:hypothetical protein FSP39_006502 [Pinctada imbricata]